MQSTRPDAGDFHATGRVSAYDDPEGRGPLPAVTVVGRLATFVGISMVAMLLIPAIVYPFIQFTGAITGTRLVAYGVMSCLAMLVATAVCVRWFGESWATVTRLGLTQLRTAPLAGGFAAGWFAITVPTGLLIWIGALVFVSAPPGDWWRAASGVLLVLVPSALSEELLFRGYAFSLLQRGWSTAVAVIATSIAFGLLHLLNANVSVRAILLVAVAGVFLALVRLAFDSLWAAWMAHLAYNFSQSAVFHAPVSGLAVEQPYYRLVPRGAEWLNGGAWGPEGGVGAVFGMLVISILLSLYAGWLRVSRQNGRWVIEWRRERRKES